MPMSYPWILISELLDDDLDHADADDHEEETTTKIAARMPHVPWDF